MSEKLRQKRDDVLALALARGLSVEAAACAAGFSGRTAHRRLELQQFRDRVQALRDELFSRTVGKLAALNAHAATTLKKLLNAESEQIRLAAAKAILEIGNRLRETTERPPRYLTCSAG